MLEIIQKFRVLQKRQLSLKQFYVLQMATANKFKKKKQGESTNKFKSSVNQGSHSQHSQQKQAQYQQYYSLSQCNPLGISSTSKLFPHSDAVSRHYNIPNAISFSPMISLENQECEFIEKTGDSIQRCGGCRAYMNCYNTISKDKFICFFCGRYNFLEKKHQQTGQYPEMSQSIFQCFSPENLYLSSSPEDSLILLIDITIESYQCQMLYYLTSVLKDIFSRPEFDDTYLSVYTYDTMIQQYDFSGQQTKCVILDPSIIRTQQSQQFCLKDIRERFFEFLDSLELIAQENPRKGSNLADAFSHIFPFAQQNKSKIYIFQANQSLIGQAFFQQKIIKGGQTHPPINCLLTNSKLLDKYGLRMINSVVSFSFFCFARNYKNLKIWADLSKVTSSQIYYYSKDSGPELEKFYYDLNYSISSINFKQVTLQLVLSQGYSFHAVYGNLYRIKQTLSFKMGNIDPSKKVLCVIMPTSNPRTVMPYLSLQGIVNYRYKGQDYMTVFTTVFPFSGHLDRLLSSIDQQTIQTILLALHRSYISSIRTDKTSFIKKKVFDAAMGVWVTLHKVYPPENIPHHFMTLFNSFLSMMKSIHSEIDSANNTPILDKIISQRNLFQFCGIEEIVTYFNPCLMDLTHLQQDMCREDIDFIYPDTLQLRFKNIKQGLYLLDNGISLYLFIAKKCSPQILQQVFGIDHLTKNTNLSQQKIEQTESFRSSQIQTLIRVLRQQKRTGWIPLHIVRCGQNTNKQRNFYMNFYPQKYQQFRNYQASFEEFMEMISRSQ